MHLRTMNLLTTEFSVRNGVFAMIVPLLDEPVLDEPVLDEPVLDEPVLHKLQTL
jgi:hypothetical protein